MSNRSLTWTSFYIINKVEHYRIKWLGSEQIRAKKIPDAELMHYSWVKLVLDAESHVENKFHVLLYLFFLNCCIYESSKYQQYCRNEEECFDSRHFSSAGTWIKEAILLVNASNGLSNKNIWHFTQHHWNRMGVLCFQEIESNLTRYLWKFSSLLKQFCLEITLIGRTHLQMRLLRLTNIVLMKLECPKLLLQ